MQRLPLGGLAAAALSLLFALPPGAAAEEEPVMIPFEVFRLDNGLTVVVHEDRKAPIVAVNLWYHVGSKNEPPGRTGFAHLFEHLMFQGSENYNDEYFKPFDLVGATDQNGTTSFDRTNYFQNVPTPALDLALWMESDRMGHLLGVIDQERLDEQRGVVQNEKRQGENQPYGRVYDHVFRNVFPEGHPYSWMPIGSMEDLNAATLEDVRDWFRTYYGPNNTVLVLAGDIDVETAKEKAELYFGDIPPGPPLSKMERWIPDWSGERREIMADRVPQARVYKTWPAPEWGADDAAYLDLATSILSQGKTSRFYQRLVYEEQVATDVGAFPYFGEIAGVIVMWATAAPGQSLEEVERLLDEELARFLDKGPTKQEVERVRTQARAGFLRGMERVGGFGGKSDILAEHMVYGGDPGLYRRTLAQISKATPGALAEAARRWIDDGVYVLEVRPFPQDLRARAGGADRSSLPYPDDYPEPDFPAFERATLDNGLELVVARRDAIPVVQFNLLLDAGYAADQLAQPGVASLAMSMLDEGTAKRSALEISEELAQLGARLGAGSNVDVSTVTLSALKENLDASLEIFADVVLNPAFPENELERLRKQTLAAIQREKVTPNSMALRVLPRLLYGEGHAYALPLTGSGTEASVAAIERDELERFHDTWFRPNNATLVVVGDTSVDEIAPKLERLFADWQPGDTPDKNIAEVERPASPSLYLIDRPGSQQSVVLAGLVMPPTNNPDEIAIEAMNDVLGGTFSSRINMNLREDKGWSYGAFSTIVDAEGQRPFLVFAPVQADKTSESLAEIRAELAAVLGDEPATAEEVERVRRERTLTLPGRWETAARVAGDIGAIVRFGLPDDYWAQYPDRVNALDVPAVQSVTESLIDPTEVTWVVVGDRSVVEPGLEALGIADIQVLDADGNPIETE